MENNDDTNHLKFPIGPFTKKDEYSYDELSSLISDIECAPAVYKDLIQGIDAADLLKTYRPGSWNIQQLVHHVADMQLLHFFRMKRAITEPDYKEVTLVDINGWANTKDGFSAPIEDSLVMLEGITKRYLFLIRSLSQEQLSISYYHPVRAFNINQVQAVAMSAWHVKHHLAHIKIAMGN
ncbi:DinB family protein [Pedobacter sp. GR22-6]|uniref:DinB family protein n=1 Tax=Pedobacter sp. GR22-6 TaxID=3127957 RepID=UPI00307F49F0